MRYLIGLVMLATGCSGSDDPGAGVECAQSDRGGTYLLEFETIDGNCGDVPSSVGRLDSATALADGCVLDGADIWSESDCKLERAYTCEADQGRFVSYVASTRQTDSEGDVLTGTASITIRNGDGGPVICLGTYRITATRQ